MPHPKFDRSRLLLRPLAERTHGFSVDELLPLTESTQFEAAPLARIAKRMQSARQRHRPVIALIGAHVLRSGAQRFLIDWMQRGLLTHIGMNGGAAIHDYELALVGATTESVARYISDGQFGFWTETGGINAAATAAAARGIGLGEALGAEIAAGSYAHADVSVLCQAYRLGVPATIHVGIGYDIVHQHPNASGAAIGEASYSDFLVLAHTVSGLEGGVVLSIGSAVMAPEVFLKALAMARNVAQQDGKRIAAFTCAVFDLLDLGSDLSQEPDKSEARYYFRPFKTLLVRTVADGGESHYVRGPHQNTIPALHRHLERAAT
jgi:hypothetical protein